MASRTERSSFQDDFNEKIYWTNKKRSRYLWGLEAWKTEKVQSADFDECQDIKRWNNVLCQRCETGFHADFQAWSVNSCIVWRNKFLKTKPENETWNICAPTDNFVMWKVFWGIEVFACFSFKLIQKGLCLIDSSHFSSLFPFAEDK